MGKVLQIRVTASTYDPRDVERRWPGLCALAWPPDEMPRGDMRRDGTVGVLELVGVLGDEVRYGKMDPAARKALEPLLEGVETLGSRLDAALGDWKPAEANALSDQLEEALDRLEQSLPR
ncbi:MAG: hypothetical protein AB1916_00280 [Thermodesulfobacteriota bacterium]